MSLCLLHLARRMQWLWPLSRQAEIAFFLVHGNEVSIEFAAHFEVPTVASVATVYCCRAFTVSRYVCRCLSAHFAFLSTFRPIWVGTAGAAYSTSILNRQTDSGAR